MTRVDELQKKYPGIPREVIIKMDVIRNGIRDSADLDKTCVWDRAGGSFLSYDLDATPRQMQERKQETAKAGFIKSPEMLYLRNGLGALVMRTSKSPYEVKAVGEGKYALYEGEAKVDDVFFMGRGDRPERVTSKGTPVTSLIRVTRRCTFIFPVRHCEYFSTGDQCRYCNFQPNQQEVRSLGLYRPVTIDLDETVEAFKILAGDARLVECHVEMGAIVNKETEARIYLQFLERLANAAPYKPDMIAQPQPIDRKDMQRMRDVGVDSITLFMEVWDPDLFAEICPGKAKSRGYDGYLQSYLDAVDVFGPGHVGCNFVGGVTMIPANGHKTWQDCRDSTAEGVRWMVEHGVHATVSALRVQPGSVYGAEPANQEKRPPTEYYLDLCTIQTESMKKHSLYDKLDKLMWCAMDCLPYTTGGDIGILEKSGDIGTWLSDTIPDEANWMARFTSMAMHSAST